MKKIIFIIAAFVALEGSAFATAGGVPAAPFSFKPSNNVSIAYDAAASGAQAYSVISKHSAGNRLYSTTNATSNIWFQNVAVSDAVTSSSVTPGESTYTGWSSQ